MDQLAEVVCVDEEHQGVVEVHQEVEGVDLVVIEAEGEEVGEDLVEIEEEDEVGLVDQGVVIVEDEVSRAGVEGVISCVCLRSISQLSFAVYCIKITGSGCII